ncbi:tripartite tricarboxylate transporter substrate binding protein [Pseudomonas sp. CFBP 8770]|uniref:Bug family tripartite tricarboxylate transporter substrate binding protein n=1 Tax=unclassified Pseudomonas TaxID=196821 RepID=UPI000F069C59|nr:MULTISPECIES: tripartite tricarboxylate transporter substrate binding protein [unclassified Pseudomonas]MBD8473365.1 tripartite tricarboxylate transporter substrate binding protein [Pseudomonas sp. CFBP 8773]MBD8646492.1 tripartite tricarboxylate transporter substrate binding protein [Pseudomonas sp. CFBP 8770]
MRNAFVRRTSLLMLGCSMAAAGAFPALATAAWQPDKNVEIVVAGGPGGGTDQLGRLIQSIISTHKLLDVNTIVLNKGGGNGAEAFLDLKMNKGDPEKLVIGTNNIYLLPLVAKLGYQWQELTPVAAVAEDDFILWSYKDAPWKDAKGFYQAAQADPAKMRMGGSQSKDVDQTLTLLLNQTNNSKLVYIPFKSGSEAATQLAGKHIAANVNNPSESISQWRGDQIEPLCVFSKERMTYTDKVAGDKSWADVPTCYEQGLGIDQYRFPRTVFMPGEVTAEQRAFYVELMRKVTETPEFKAYVKQNALVPTFLEGEPLTAYIEKDTARVTPVFKEAGWLKN